MLRTRVESTRCLNALIAREPDAAEAAGLALCMTAGRGRLDRLEVLAEEHERHVRNLCSLVLAAGGAPRSRSEVLGSVLTNEVIDSGIVGGNLALLLPRIRTRRQSRKAIGTHWR